MDMITIAGALSGANTAFTAVKNALGTNTKIEINAAITDLSDALRIASQAALVLQEQVVTLDSEKAELKKDIARLKRTHHEFENYRFRNVGTGAFVYAYEPAMKADGQGAQPAKDAHWLCVPCFDDDFISILQLSPGETGIYHHVLHKCPRCQSAISVDLDTKA